MNNRLHLETLNKLNSYQHYMGNITDVLPFSSNDSKAMLKGEVKPLVGGFSRAASKCKLKNEEAPLLTNEGDENILDSMLTEVKSEFEEDKKELKRLLSTLLFKDGHDVEAIHPHIFMYYPRSNNKKGNLESKVSYFLADVLEASDSEIANSFAKSDDEDILIRLILHHLNELEENSKQQKTYQNVLPTVKKLFHEDFKFLSKHRDYFLDHFETLLQHYYFLYVSQLVFKFAQGFEMDVNHVSPLYYSLDWEALNKRRKAFDDIYNFRGLREHSPSVFIHMHVQAQLSHNWLNKTEDFMTYQELYKRLNEETNLDEQEQFLDDLNEWLLNYAEHKKINWVRKQEDLESATQHLYELLREGMSSEVCKNVGRLVEDAAYGKFLKSRGNLGYTLNITQDFLLLLTAISVKDQVKIPLKQLFVEFEKRGVKLDRYSQKEVVQLLDSLNIIEKKSDSGDAQYVKPIL